ncbi:MAG: type II toxin-antitoxin system HicA family toxin [Elusimicrobiota bacterium]|jgi:predicted RNA binding protein YcfA (HicA-like mRNA interferase family)|nr:type II toxin-antitoxin system HicA family toxin [Elusimicrobiota bacterium]
MSAIHTVKLSKLRRFLRYYGFVEDRQESSHIIFEKKGLERPIPIPIHAKEVRFYSCKQIMNALNMTRETFEKELRKF